MKMYVRTRKEGIVDFYNAVAEQLGFDSEKVNYDCRKILVSKERFDAINMAYEDSEDFAMRWLCLGPKTDEMLQGDEVIIEDGFIIEVNADEVVA